MRKMTIVAGLACILSAPAQCWAKGDGVEAEAGDTVESEWDTPICSSSRDLQVAQQFLIANQIGALKGLDCTTLTVADKVTVLSKVYDERKKARVMFEYAKGKYVQGYVNLSHFTSEKTKPIYAIDQYEGCRSVISYPRTVADCAHLDPAPGYAECRRRIGQPHTKADCAHLVLAPGTK